MSRTIGKHRPQSSPIGDFQAMCSYCGVVWLRSQMWVDDSGKLVCPDEGRGIGEVGLSRVLAQEAARPKRLGWKQQGFPTDHNDDPDPTTGAPTQFIDIVEDI